MASSSSSSSAKLDLDLWDESGAYDPTLNRPLLDEIATASGGRVVGPTGVPELASLFLGDELVQQKEDGTGRVDRHRGRDVAEGYLREEPPHVVDRIDGDTDLSDLADGEVDTFLAALSRALTGFVADALGALLGGVLFTFVLIQWVGLAGSLGLIVLLLSVTAWSLATDGRVERQPRVRIDSGMIRPEPLTQRTSASRSSRAMPGTSATPNGASTPPRRRRSSPILAGTDRPPA